MTGRSDTERFLDAFLAPEGTEQLSNRVLEAALSDVARTPQRRVLRMPWRFTGRPVTYRAVAAVMAVAVVVGASGLIFLDSRGFVGGRNPTPSPKPSPTTTFDSPQYRYSVDIPTGWIVRAASLPWPGGDGVDPPDALYTDIFRVGNGAADAEVTVKAQALAGGVTSAAWLSDWEAHRAVGGQCFSAGSHWTAATVAGMPALYLRWRCDGSVDRGFDEYTFLAAGMGFVVSGSPSMVEVIVRSFRSTLVDTTGWIRYTSARYGLEIAYPPGWTVMPSDHRWTWDRDATDPLSTGSDVFLAPHEAIRVSVWTVPLAQEIDETWAANEAWAVDYCSRSQNTPCTGIHARVVPMCIEKRDCHAGVIVAFDQGVVFFGHGGILPDGMTVVALWRPKDGPTAASYGGGTGLLRAFLSTMGVFPPWFPESQAAAATFLATGK